MKSGLRIALLSVIVAGTTFFGIPYVFDSSYRNLWTRHPLQNKKGFERNLTIDDKYEVKYEVKEAYPNISPLFEQIVDEELTVSSIGNDVHTQFFVFKDRNNDGHTDDAYFSSGSSKDELLSVKKTPFTLSYDSELMTRKQAQQLLQKGDEFFKKVKEDKGLEQALAEYSFGWRNKEIPGIK
ncbi:MAG: hypothetical protein AABX39_03455 [Nanoarchaeota archaeon]